MGYGKNMVWAVREHSVSVEEGARRDEFSKIGTKRAAVPVQRSALSLSSNWIGLL